MDAMNLFVQDPALVFEKSATVELEEDPTAWPRQVLTELYRAVPEISDYLPEVNFLKVDEEKGFGLGVVVVSSSTSTALSSEVAGAPAGRKALIPVIVKGHKLLPLDILMSPSGKMTPLTAQRLSEALFRPENFDLMSEDFGDTSLWNMFHPPGRGDSTYGSGVSQGLGGTAGSVSVYSGPGMKLSSAGFEMLLALSGTLLESDVTKIAEQMETTPGLLKAASQNPNFLGALKLLADPAGLAKHAVDLNEVVGSLYPAQVVQLGYSEVSDRYSVKTANREVGHLSQKWMERGEFLKFAGSELTKRVDTEGTLTIAEKNPEVVVIEGPNGDGLEVCDRSGYYAVYTKARGRTMTGWVVPGLMDGKGNKLPLALYTDGKSYAVQDQIAVGNNRSGDRIDMPNAAPRGTGCFWYSTENYGDRIRATVPLEVQGASRNEDGSTTYMCRDLMGGDLKITLSYGAQGVVAIPGANELIMPHSTGFAPLGEEVELINVGALRDKGNMLKGAALDPVAARITVAAHGDSYTLRFAGDAAKLASLYGGRELGTDEAAFALCLAGHDGPGAFSALAQADARGTFSVRAADIGSLDLSGHYKAAAAKVADVHGLRRNLLKEAAALPDVMSVDAVLSLGFINTDNVGLYIARLPYLEKALTMICEMVLASRVGLSEIPEAAASRAAKSVDEVVMGLKSLALREIEDVA
jgi:hypothetical protein